MSPLIATTSWMKARAKSSFDSNIRIDLLLSAWDLSFLFYLLILMSGLSLTRQCGEELCAVVHRHCR